LARPRNLLVTRPADELDTITPEGLRRASDISGPR
jgi:hypothetical protein